MKDDIHHTRKNFLGRKTQLVVNLDVDCHLCTKMTHISFNRSAYS